jgi:hypothetical protein
MPFPQQVWKIEQDPPSWRMVARNERMASTLAFTNFGHVRVESGFKTHIAVANLFCQTFPSGESSS